MFFHLSYVKYLLTTILFIVSIYLLISGYQDLKKEYQYKFYNKINFEKKREISINENNKINNESLKIDNPTKIELNDNDNDNSIETIIIVKKNDTFSKIIYPYVNDDELKNSIIVSINEKYNLKNLKINQKIFFYQNKNKILKKIVIPLNFTNDLIVEINDNNKVETKNYEISTTSEIIANKFSIESSLYEDGIQNQIPLIVLSEVIKLLSFDVDFQRDIQKNNTLEISYEILTNKNREDINFGKIQYVNLSLQKNNLEYFFFETQDGYINYFNKNGKNAQKSLMKTPIDGARLSSSFGMRKHPILGYNKLHKGLDFAAPKGTPIYAAGNGVIEYVGRNGSYGKYIRIRHNGSYKTAYAHLSKYKKGIYKGMRVNQRDIIGYVGSTGRSTGPHLHYEVIYQGKQINPKKMNLPSRKILEGEELKKFKIEAKKIYSDYLFHLYE